LSGRYGTMHVVATNIVLWIRTLIKETMEEITEISEIHLHKESAAVNYQVCKTDGPLALAST
jgi:hypothetical protein